MIQNKDIRRQRNQIIQNTDIRRYRNQKIQKSDDPEYMSEDTEIRQCQNKDVRIILENHMDI